MSVESLATRLLERPGFRARLDSVVADSIASQFLALERVEALKNPNHDWSYLLTSASVLAQARNAECEDASLRIAQHWEQHVRRPHFQQVRGPHSEYRTFGV